MARNAPNLLQDLKLIREELRKLRSRLSNSADLSAPNVVKPGGKGLGRASGRNANSGSKSASQRQTRRATPSRQGPPAQPAPPQPIGYPPAIGPATGAQQALGRPRMTGEPLSAFLKPKEVERILRERQSLQLQQERAKALKAESEAVQKLNELALQKTMATGEPPQSSVSALPLSNAIKQYAIGLDTGPQATVDAGDQVYRAYLGKQLLNQPISAILRFGGKVASVIERGVELLRGNPFLPKGPDLAGTGTDISTSTPVTSQPAPSESTASQAEPVSTAEALGSVGLSPYSEGKIILGQKPKPAPVYGTDTTGTAFEADKALQQAAKDAMKEAVKQGQAGPPAAPTAVAYPTATTQSQQAANMVSVLQADPEYAKILDLQDELYKTIQDIKTDNSELSFFDVLLGALTGGASLLLQPKKLSAIRRRKMLPTYYSMYERALQLGLSYRSLAAQTVAAINKAEQAQLKEIEEQKKMAPGIFQASMEISQSLGLYFKKLRAELLKTLNPNDSQAVDNFYGRTLEDILLHPLFSYDLSSKWPGREYFNEKGELDVRRVLKDVQLGKLDPAVQVYLLGRNAILKRLSGLPLDSAEEEVDSLTGPNGRLTLLLKELETKQRDATALVGNQDTKQGFFNTMVAAQETLRKLINDLDEYIARRRAKEEQ